MRGVPHFNYPAFDKAAGMLRGLGHTVFSPADHDRVKWGAEIGLSETGDVAEITEQIGFDLRQAMIDDLTYVAFHADAVVLLPGWEDSDGAQAESMLALALGKQVLEVGLFEEAAA
jgi:hypothetical protein